MTAHVSLARCTSETGRHSWATCAAENCLTCGMSRYAIQKELHRLRRLFAQTGKFK